MTEKRFKIALSFAGEHREYVEQVANALAKEFGEGAVFYDNWYEHEIIGLDSDEYLQPVYHEQTQLIVPFFCVDYAQKQWCGLEWRAIKDLIKIRRGRDVLPFRFDDVSIKGVYSTDVVPDITKRTPEDIAKLIIKRWQFNKYEINSAEPKPAPEVKIEIPAAPLIQKPADDWQSMGKFKVKDGLALDNETGLMWLRFAHGQTWQNGTVEGKTKEVDWQTAFIVAEEFNQQGGYAGFTDWRLPTIDELKTLIDKEKGKEGNYIDVDVFPNNSPWFWSSSPYSSSSASAWFVYFCYGYGGRGNKKYSDFVRLVRNAE